MPRVSEFYGIAVYFYYADHNPPTSTPSTADSR